MENNDQRPKLYWGDRTEELLISWGDMSKCYTWLHEKSFRVYNRKNYYFSIPIIILSTMSGAASVGMNGYVPSSYSSIAQLGIGFINIFTGIITTLQNFFRYAQNSESHLNASNGWSKLNRNISIELSLERDRRKNAHDFVKVCRAEYDRLMEQSPTVPSHILKRFKTTMKLDPKIILPDIVDKITHTRVYTGLCNDLEPSKKAVFDEVAKSIEESRQDSVVFEDFDDEAKV